MGGIGMRRGRRDPEWLVPGDTVDFWRVEACEPNRLLRLIAEMKMPGQGRLEFEVSGHDSKSTLRITATLQDAGILGVFYWYALYPFHKKLFTGLLHAIAARIPAKEVR